MSPPSPSPASRSPKLLDRLRQALTAQRFAPAQADAFAGWVEASLRFHGLRPPRHLGPEQVAAFVRQLSSEPQATPQDEAAARAALRFLYDVFLPADAVAAPPAEPPAQLSPGPPPPREEKGT